MKEPTYSAVADQYVQSFENGVVPGTLRGTIVEGRPMVLRAEIVSVRGWLKSDQVTWKVYEDTVLG